MTPCELLEYLDSLGIVSRTVEHEPVFTVDEARRLRSGSTGAHTKALFLRSRDGRLWILVTPADRRPDLKLLSGFLGGGRLSFPAPEELTRRLGVTPGAVTPFAAANDVEGLVSVVVDRALLAFDELGFHPLDNSRTTTISPADLLRFLESVDHTPTIADVGYV